MAEQKPTINWLNNCRIAAAFAVVVLHVSAIVVLNRDFGTSAWWAGNIFEVLVRWSVPVFVMISGALLLAPGKAESIAVFYKHRIARILIPLLFWSLFYLAWAQYMGTMNREPLSKIQLARLLVGGHPASLMWYIFMIAVLYLFIPFLRKIIRDSSRAELRVLLVIGFAFSILNSVSGESGIGSSKLFVNWFIVYIPYLLLGYLISTSKRQYSIVKLCVTLVGIAAFSAVGCAVVGKKFGPTAGMYFYNYLSLTVIMTSAILFILARRWESPIGGLKTQQALASATLGIYLMHMVFIDLFRILKMGPLAFNPAISIPCEAVVVFGAAAAITLMIGKIPYIRRIV